MRKLLLSALLASGLTLAGASAYAIDDQPQKTQTQEQQTNQGTEIERDAQDSGAMEQNSNSADEATDTDTTNTGTTEEQSQGQGEEYVVQDGDTLSSIAKEKLGSEDKWQDIAQANKLDNPDQLQVGQKLVIPSSDQMNSESSDDMNSEETQPTQESGKSQQSEPEHEHEAPSQNY